MYTIYPIIFTKDEVLKYMFTENKEKSGEISSFPFFFKVSTDNLRIDSEN